MLGINRISKLQNIILLNMIILLMITAGFPAKQNAYAQSEPLQISVQTGWDGKIKPFKWYPVQFTITNPGSDLTGELAVHVSSSSDKDTIYSAKVDLPSQTTKVVTIELPGELLNSKNNKVEFYEQSVARGKSVPIANEPLILQTDAVTETTMQVGVVSRDADTLNFLAFLNQRGYQVRNFPLSIEDIPGEAILLDGLDVLVLNDIDAGLFTQEQVDAITGWVNVGGTLILAGGAAYPKTAEPFAALSPVSYSQTRSVTNLTALEQASARELVFNQPFTLSEAVIVDGRAVLLEQDIPLFVQADRGLGKVLYAAYDLSLQPVASWSGNADLWETLLFDELSFSLAAANQGNRGFSWELNDALEHFRSLTPPSVALLLLVMLVYAVIIGPLLYMVLKKMDRREWAWVAIPLIAIISSAAIYGVGASGRGSIMTQSFHTIQLDGQGSAYRSSVAAVFVPNGGSFNVSLPGSYYASPLQVNHGGSTELRGSADLVIEKNPDATNLKFQGVPYWSVRKLQYETGSHEATGHWEYTLDSSTLSGRLTSGLDQSLEQVHVYYNGQVISLGKVSQNETVDFQLSQAGTGRFNNVWDIAQMMFPYQGDRDENRQKRALLQEYLLNPKNNFNPAGTYVFGFSSVTHQSSFTIDGKTVNSEDVSLWVQPLEYDYMVDGQIHLPAGAITPMPDFGSTQLHYKDGFAYDLGPGEVVLSYRLPRESGVQYERLENFQAYTDASVTYEIWNEASQSWEEILTGDSLEQLSAFYLTNNNTLIIRLSLSHGNYVRFPDFVIKGTVNP
ncbi:DUF7408 domain-containing protein [Paenibacillus senegalensis]|uniref:DUF7408 domain-containing protein n=1 Tax=Paenibacillus senegalensis TaxID=1465766 RepID=UPI0002899028|nr:hypothetical protein [Paenibacillus senegalensis]